jgi:hypothetical protein
MIDSHDPLSRIFLRAINQTWTVHYIESDINLRLISRPHQEIAIAGRIQNKTACQKLLIAWLKQLAKIHLHEKLNVISQTLNLPYTKLTIRDQKTRWGSCTRNKNISLNYKLIFLPEELTRHILIHELCHTVHLNHSTRFWKLVEKFDPDYEKHRSAVRKVDEFLPPWTMQ